MNQVSLGEKDGTAKDDDGRLQANLLVEGVETRSRKDKATNVRQTREQIDGQRNGGLATISREELDGGLLGSIRRGLLSRSRGRTVMGVLAHVWVVHGPELVGVFAFVLLDIGLVDPAKGFHEHVVERRADVSHEAHEEEGNLQDRVFDKVQAVNDFIVPSRALEVCEQANEGEEDADSEGLRKCQLGGLCKRRAWHTGMETRMRMAMPAATAKAACL